MRSQWITMPQQSGVFVHLELLDTERHMVGLAAAGADPRIWEYMLCPPADTPAGMRAHVEQLMQDWQAGQEVPYVVSDLRTRQIIGCSRFRELQPAHLSLELGTWLTPSAHGNGSNADLKYVMLSHAFEALGCIRVQLKTDARNTASQRSLTALGAHYEGRLRNHLITSNGHIRDSLVYAITDAEWPAIKAHLWQRIQRHQATGEQP